MTSSLWGPAFLAALALFQLVAVPALWLRKNDLADVLWGPAFPLCAFSALAGTGQLGNLGARKILVLSCLLAWALRLFVHVGWRNLSHLHQEDVRYAKWRREWGSTWFWRSYLQVFVLQPLILYLFLVPVLFLLGAADQPLGPLAYLGTACWLTGFFFETVGDEQLRRFKRNPANRGKLMTTGLWSWTRHPHYFGEVLLWWGIWLIALELPGAWWTVIGPLGVTYLLLQVSGVSMLEELMRQRSGYAEYAARVPRFFPRPPRRR